MSFNCYKCKENFVYRHEYILHRVCHTEHKNNRTPSYKKCYVDCHFKRKNILFLILSYNYQSISLFHFIISFRCDDCSKEYANESNCKKHITTHTQNVQNDFILCDKRFSCQRYLKEHLQMHCLGNNRANNSVITKLYLTN